MEKPVAYSGSGLYAFACYSHADAEEIYPDIAWLQEQGINLWYDEGIDSGSEWSEFLANRIGNARQFVFFASPSSVDSKHCRSEIQFAFSRNIPFIVVYVEKAKLTAGLELALGSTQALLKAELPEKLYRERLLASFDDRVASPAADYQPHVRPEQPAETKLAVLPFLNLSPDPESEYFSLGIAEDILNRLARSKTFKVVARSSSFRFKPNDEDVRDIAKTLGVSHVVEGSVMKANERVRVSANLIEGSHGEQLWSDAYNQQLTDIFEIQDKISTAIAAELHSQLAPTKEAPKSESSVAAHDDYLKGTHQLWKGTLESLYEAIAQFNLAIEQDDTFADAWALLAYAYMLTCADPQADRSLEDNRSRFRRAANRALELDPDSDKANLSMAMYKMAAHEWGEAERYFIKSLSINRHSPQALGYYGYFLANTRRTAKGARYADAAVRTDPFNCHELARKAQLYSYIGEFDAARDAALRALEIEPDYKTPHVWLVGIFGSLGDHHSAIHSMQRWNLVDLVPSDGDVASFERALEEEGVGGYLEYWYKWLLSREQRGARTPHLNWFIALYAALTGRIDEAFTYLEEAWTQTFLVPDLVFFEPLRGDPRWRAMLERERLTDADVEALESAAADTRRELSYEDPF